MNNISYGIATLITAAVVVPVAWLWFIFIVCNAFVSPAWV